jgi:hypothetical protein
MHHPYVTWVLDLLCSGLDNEDERQSAPLTEALYCTSTRRASSRCAWETAGKRKLPQQRTREKCLCAVAAHVHTVRGAFCCWSEACSPHPARYAGWSRAFCWRLLHVSRRAILDLTRTCGCRAGVSICVDLSSLVNVEMKEPPRFGYPPSRPSTSSCALSSSEGLPCYLVRMALRDTARCHHLETRTRTNTISFGTKAIAAG